MLELIKELSAFIHNDQDHRFGTQSKDEVKKVTSEGTIEITKDTRWTELLHLADVFSGM